MSNVHRFEADSLGLGRLFHEARDAVVVGDPKTGRILLWNKAAETMFGYTEEEALDRLLEDLVPQRLKEAHRSGLARFAATGHGPLVDSGQVVELPALRKDGIEIVVELTLTPLKNDRPSANFAMAVIRDVTDRAEAQIKLEEANAELHRLNEAMKDFVAVASHDLRSPLTSILGFAATIKTRLDAKGETEDSEFASIIERQARHLSSIVEGILTLSRIESEALDPAIQPVQVAEAAHRAIGNYFDEVDVTVEVDPAIRVLVDPDHLQRILANLISNAIRHAVPPIEVEAQSVEGNVEIRVCDSGEGVPKAFEERLFQKFAKGERSGTIADRGTGLGLSIVKGLAEANGGNAWYRKNEAPGSTFGVTLPAASKGESD